MVDNVAITAGTGTTIGADDIAGVLIQRVKTTWGPDGTANDTDIATGKPLPIQVRSATGLVPLGEPTDAKSTATDATSATAISVLKQISASVQAPPSQAVTNTGTFATQAAATIADGAAATIGAKADAKSTATDTTAITAMSVWKQISASVQAMVTAIGTPNANGQAAMASSAPVVIASNQTTLPVTPADQYSQYETVAASQTAQALGGTGATGDYLAGVLVFPGTAGCGVVTILDNATGIGTFAGGGTTALPSLVPFMIPVGLVSVSGAWKITTGANVTAVGIGKFTA